MLQNKNWDMKESEALEAAAKHMQEFGYQHDSGVKYDSCGCFIHHIPAFTLQLGPAIYRLEDIVGSIPGSNGRNPLSADNLQKIGMTKERAIEILQQAAAQARIKEQS